MLYHLDPHQWPWGQGHRLWNFMFKFLVKVFRKLYLLKLKLDLVDTWPDIRYWSKLLRCTIPTPSFSLKSRSQTLKFYVKVFSWSFFFSTFILWKQLRQIVGRTSVSLVTLTCGSGIEGQPDPYFMVQWFCLEDYLMYEHHTLGLWVSMTRHVTLKKCRSLWPIFHGPVILPYILKTVWCMNIILRDYESVWPDVWPQNKCRSLWPYFMV